jgi:hypothetical protein
MNFGLRSKNNASVIIFKLNPFYSGTTKFYLLFYMCVCKTSSLSLREEHKFPVSGKRALRSTIRPRMDEEQFVPCTSYI